MVSSHFLNDLFILSFISTCPLLFIFPVWYLKTLFMLNECWRNFEDKRDFDLNSKQLWARVPSRAGFRQLLVHTIPSLIVVSQAEKGSLSKRTPTSSQQLECAIFLTARSRPGKTIRELVTWSVFRERQPTYCSTFGERTSSRPRWPELLIPMLILTLTRCNVKVSNLVKKKNIWNWKFNLIKFCKDQRANRACRGRDQVPQGVFQHFWWQSCWWWGCWWCRL